MRFQHSPPPCPPPEGEGFGVSSAERFGRDRKKDLKPYAMLTGIETAILLFILVPEF